MVSSHPIFPVDPSTMPTAKQVAEVMNTMPYEVEQCYYKPCKLRRYSDQAGCETCKGVWGWGDHVDDPDRCKTDEIWIELLGVWVRVTDWSFTGDGGRGRVYCGWLDRWRLRRAYKRWKGTAHA